MTEDEKCRADAPEEGKNSSNGEPSPPKEPKSSFEELVLGMMDLHKGILSGQQQIIALLTQVISQQGDLLAILIDDEADEEQGEDRPMGTAVGKIRKKFG